MALIKCLECKADISDKAEKCPQCGAKRKKEQTPAQFLISICIGLVCAYFAFNFFASGGVSATSYDSGPLPVTYRITGTAQEVSVTYINATGGMEQITTGLPWSKQIQVPAGKFLSISAQNQKEWGTVEVYIFGGGTLLGASKSEGAYKIASANGTCCQ